MLVHNDFNIRIHVPPIMEWCLPPEAPAGWLFGEELVDAVTAALKGYHEAARLGGSALASLQAVARFQREKGVADDRLGRACALRGVLRSALARLAARGDGDAAALLEARFIKQQPLATFETRGLARATVLRRSRRALEALAWEVWELENEARRVAIDTLPALR